MLSSLISRQLATEQPVYQRFADTMNKWGYLWEAIEVPTADLYVLTTFHITGKIDHSVASTKGAVLIQHGMNQDATSWLDDFGNDKPFQLQLYDQGYDIWLGNNRGTEYSRQHEDASISEE